MIEEIKLFTSPHKGRGTAASTEITSPLVGEVAAERWVRGSLAH